MSGAKASKQARKQASRHIYLHTHKSILSLLVLIVTRYYIQLIYITIIYRPESIDDHFSFVSGVLIYKLYINECDYLSPQVSPPSSAEGEDGMAKASSRKTSHGSNSPKPEGSAQGDGENLQKENGGKGD